MMFFPAWFNMAVLFWLIVLIAWVHRVGPW